MNSLCHLKQLSAPEVSTLVVRRSGLDSCMTVMCVCVCVCVCACLFTWDTVKERDVHHVYLLKNHSLFLQFFLLFHTH